MIEDICGQDLLSLRVTHPQLDNSTTQLECLKRLQEIDPQLSLRRPEGDASLDWALLRYQENFIKIATAQEKEIQSLINSFNAGRFQLDGPWQERLNTIAELPRNLVSLVQRHHFLNALNEHLIRRKIDENRLCSKRPCFW